MRYAPARLPSPAEFERMPSTLFEDLASQLSRVRRFFGGGRPRTSPFIGRSVFEVRIGGGGGRRPDRSLARAVAAGLTLAAIPLAVEFVHKGIQKRRFLNNLRELLEEEEFKKYPQTKVINYADTLFSLNPDLATHKEVLRSYLRSTLAMDAIDPNFARSVLAKKRQNEFISSVTSSAGKVIGEQIATQTLDIVG